MLDAMERTILSMMNARAMESNEKYDGETIRQRRSEFDRFSREEHTKMSDKYRLAVRTLLAYNRGVLWHKFSNGNVYVIGRNTVYQLLYELGYEWRNGDWF